MGLRNIVTGTERFPEHMYGEKISPSLHLVDRPGTYRFHINIYPPPLGRAHHRLLV